MAFYKSSDRAYGVGFKGWLPFGGIKLGYSAYSKAPHHLKLNKYGIYTSNVDGGVRLTKWVGEGSSGGKYVTPDSAMGQISTTLGRGNISGVSVNPLNKLLGGKEKIPDFIWKLNKQLEKNGKPGLTQDFLEFVAVNAHLKNMGALKKGSKNFDGGSRGAFAGIDGDLTVMDIIDAAKAIK